MPAEESRAAPPAFGLIVIGDEILSGKRADKHLPKWIELLGERGLQLAWAEYVGDDPARITTVLRRAFDRALAGGGVAVSCGGIGATPDDHTRQCAAAALGVPLALHPQAKALIQERMRDMARDKGLPYEPERADNVQRLQMGLFPEGARIIPNPYNKIPGFSVLGPAGGGVHFVPGFPVMAWPMMGWALDTYCSAHFRRRAWQEKSVVIFQAMEAALTPVMEQVEAAHPQVKVFSLPSVDHPQYGLHIELGVKGPSDAVPLAYQDLRQRLAPMNLRYGPELVRDI
ncbi:MAG: competence/damage-inducible protein A [Burkholderiaceae bacterium]|jgi:molybdopterin-biosynthesis enzyme MoeA-like protein|nr:competence/damage-inducible protein A [Burkholderiaceae bacterium]